MIDNILASISEFLGFSFVGVLTVVLLVVGTLFMLIAAIGLVRMPDLFLRMSAATKASTLGILCMLCATALHFGDMVIALRVLAIASFLYLTAPIAAHMIGRAASADPKVSLWEETVVDERPPRE
jgi:multicomponent Na+:H+ antiporter subunit G